MSLCRPCAHKLGSPSHKAFFHPPPGPATPSAGLIPAETHCYPPSMVSVSRQHVPELPAAPIHARDRAPFKAKLPPHYPPLPHVQKRAIKWVFLHRKERSLPSLLPSCPSKSGHRKGMEAVRQTPFMTSGDTPAARNPFTGFFY